MRAGDRWFANFYTLSMSDLKLLCKSVHLFKPHYVPSPAFGAAHVVMGRPRWEPYFGWYFLSVDSVLTCSLQVIM